MRRIAVVFCVLCLLAVGCAEQPFYGKTTIEKVDGKVVSVRFVLPSADGNRRGETRYEIKSREDMDKLIGAMDALLADLKQARDQMEAVEPPPKR
jgi:hypothetical protein